MRAGRKLGLLSWFWSGSLLSLDPKLGMQARPQEPVIGWRADTENMVTQRPGLIPGGEDTGLSAWNRPGWGDESCPLSRQL